MLKTQCLWVAFLGTSVKSHSPYSTTLFWWHEGQKWRRLHENGRRYSRPQLSHRIRAKPHRKSPQSRYAECSKGSAARRDVRSGRREGGSPCEGGGIHGGLVFFGEASRRNRKRRKRIDGHGRIGESFFRKRQPAARKAFGLFGTVQGMPGLRRLPKQRISRWFGANRKRPQICAA